VVARSSPFFLSAVVGGSRNRAKAFAVVVSESFEGKKLREISSISRFVYDQICYKPVLGYLCLA
jgi:hypothetical protein